MVGWSEVSNRVLRLTAIPLYPAATGELYRRVAPSLALARKERHSDKSIRGTSCALPYSLSFLSRAPLSMSFPHRAGTLPAGAGAPADHHDGDLCAGERSGATPGRGTCLSTGARLRAHPPRSLLCLQRPIRYHSVSGGKVPCLLARRQRERCDVQGENPIRHSSMINLLGRSGHGP
jgi:hypothetical protein